MKRNSYNIFEMRGLKLCNDSRISKECMLGTLAFVSKPFCSTKKDDEDSDKL